MNSPKLTPPDPTILNLKLSDSAKEFIEQIAGPQDTKYYAVSVKFRDHGKWTKSYTYKSLQECSKDDLIVVAVRDFYMVGKVIQCKKDFIFDSSINYKIIKKIIKLEDM